MSYSTQARDCVTEPSWDRIGKYTRELPRTAWQPPHHAARPSALSKALRQGWQWLRKEGNLRLLQAKQRRLRVSETVQLGDKRFVSIVEVDGRSFLIGGSTSNVVLLTKLDENPAATSTFETMLGQALRKEDVQ